MSNNWYLWLECRKTATTAERWSPTATVE